MASMTGRVKKWFDERGFGFLECEGERDTFFHIKDWRKTIKGDPSIGDNIAFDIESKNGKDYAVNMKKV